MCGRTRILLLTHNPADRCTAWYGPDPTDVAVDPQDLKRVGLHPQRATLADVAVRAAPLTQADVRLLAGSDSPAPVEGIGALCRFG